MVGPNRIALIVAADEPAIFFTSVEEAESWMESIDVEDGVYTAAYGPDGQRYEIGSADGRATIQPSGGTAAPDELRALLHGHLEASGVSFSPADSVVDLLALCEPSYF